MNYLHCFCTLPMLLFPYHQNEGSMACVHACFRWLTHLTFSHIVTSLYLVIELLCHALRDTQSPPLSLAPDGRSFPPSILRIHSDQGTMDSENISKISIRGYVHGHMELLRGGEIQMGRKSIAIFPKKSWEVISLNINKISIRGDQAHEIVGGGGKS